MGAVDKSRLRFKDAEWAQDSLDIIVGGVGGIGSWVAFNLSRIGHKVHIFDMDKVDVENLAGQMYGNNHIDMLKTNAIKDLIESLTQGAEVSTYSEYKKDSEVCPIMIASFDNMKARKTMFENWKKQEDRELFIDGRMLAEVGMVYFVTKGDEALYEKTLFSDSEIEEAACSFKATTHCGMYIASLMVNGLNNFLANKKLEIPYRKVPFEIDFQLPLFRLELTKNIDYGKNN